MSYPTGPEYIIRTLLLHRKLCPLVAQEPRPITVTLRDGKTVDGLSWKTTSYDVACSISKGLADSTVIAKVILEPPIKDTLKNCIKDTFR